MATGYDVNLNAAQCIKEVDHLGYTSVHNICTGAVVDLPWGVDGWMAAVAISLLVIGMALVVFGLPYMVYRDSRH